MRERIYYFIIFIFIAFACFLLVGGKLKNLGRSWSVDLSAYGDLYVPSLINKFKKEIPRKDSKSLSAIKDSQVIVVGDSFAYGRLESDKLSVLIENQTDLTVFDLSSNDPFPLGALSNQKFATDTPRWLILETVERFAVKRTPEYTKELSPNSASGSASKKLIDINVFHHEDIDYFFKYNKILFSFISFLRNIRFALTGQVDTLVGAVTNDPPLLFCVEEIIFNRDFGNAEKVPAVVQKMKELEEVLKNRYNLSLLVVVVPNKYSIYSEWDKYHVYNNFLPALNKELDKNQIKHVDLYSLYKNYRREHGDQELLYYSSDSHYSPLGKQLLVDEIIKILTTN